MVTASKSKSFSSRRTPGHVSQHCSVRQQVRDGQLTIRRRNCGDCRGSTAEEGGKLKQLHGEAELAVVREGKRVWWARKQQAELPIAGENECGRTNVGGWRRNRGLGGRVTLYRTRLPPRPLRHRNRTGQARTCPTTNSDAGSFQWHFRGLHSLSESAIA